MKFSIIVPVYNVENYLRPCLDSLITQTFENLEIILVEDGSKDKSPEICQEYLRKDKRIQVYYMENKGPGATRNLGLKKATGDYVMFVDSDDFIEKDTCETFAKAIEEKNYPDILMADALYYLADKTTKPKRKGKIWEESEKGITYWVENQKRKAMASSLVVHICKRSFLVEHSLRFPEGRYHEDTHWTFQIYLKAKRVSFLPFAFYYHVMRPGSITHSVNPKRCQDILWVAEDLERIYSHQKTGYEDYLKEYSCYLCGTAVHSAILQGLSIKKTFSAMDRKRLVEIFKKSAQRKYKILGLVFKMKLWGIYGFFYWISRRNKQC